MDETVKRQVILNRGLSPDEWTIDNDNNFVPASRSNIQPTVGPSVITPKLAPQLSSDIPLTTGIKTFAQGALPSIAGGLAAGGAAYGLGAAGLGLTTTGAGALAGIPLIGLAAYLGSKGGQKIQQAVEPQEWQQNVAASQQQNPWAARLGEMSTIPLGGLSPSPTRTVEAVGTLGKILGSLGRTESSLGRTPFSRVDELSNLLNVGAGAGLGAGQNILGQLGSNQPFNISDLLQSAALGAGFNKPNKPFGTLYGFHDLSAQPDIAQQIQPQLGYGQPRVSTTGDITPSSGVVTGQFGDVYDLNAPVYKPEKGKVKPAVEPEPYVRGEDVTKKSAAESASVMQEYYGKLQDQIKAEEQRVASEQADELDRQQAVERLNELYNHRAALQKIREQQETEMQQKWSDLLAQKAAQEATPKYYPSKTGVGPQQVAQSSPEGLTTVPTTGPLANLVTSQVSARERRPIINRKIPQVTPEESAADLETRRIEALQAGEERPKYSEESKLKQPSDIYTGTEKAFAESGQPSQLKPEGYKIINDWAKSKGITISDNGNLIDATNGKPISGSMIETLGGLPKEIQINPNKAGADTQMHEIGHWVMSLLRNSDRPRDVKFVKKFEDIVSKDADYQRWKSERDASNLSSTPDEYIATNQGYEFLNRSLSKETPFKQWLNDFSSYAKTRFTKHADVSDYQRLLNYKVMYEISHAPSGAVGGVGNVQQSEQSKLVVQDPDNLRSIIGDIDRVREGLESEELNPKAAISAKGGLVDSYDWSTLPKTKLFLDDQMKPNSHLSWNVLKKVLVNEVASLKGIKAPPFQEQLKPKSEFNIPEGETPESLQAQIEEPTTPSIERPSWIPKSGKELSDKLKVAETKRQTIQPKVIGDKEGLLNKVAARDEEYAAVVKNKNPKNVEFYLRDEYENAVKAFTDAGKSGDEAAMKFALGRMRDLESKHDALISMHGLSKNDYPPLNQTKYSEESKFPKAAGEGEVPTPFTKEEYLPYIGREWLHSKMEPTKVHELIQLMNETKDAIINKTGKGVNNKTLDRLLYDPEWHDYLRNAIGDYDANSFIDRAKKFQESLPKSLRQLSEIDESIEYTDPWDHTKNQEQSKLPWSSFAPTKPALDKVRQLGDQGEVASNALTKYFPEKDNIFGKHMAPIIKSIADNKLTDAQKNHVEEVGKKEFRDSKDYSNELSSAELSVHKVIRDQLRQKQEDQRIANQPVTRYKANGSEYKDLPKINSFYWPMRISPKVAETISEDPNGIEAKQYRKDFIDNNLRAGISEVEAAKKWSALRTSYDKGETNLTRFNANRKMEGVGLPDSMMRPGLKNNIYAYFNRVAADRAWHDTVESDPEAANALGVKQDAWGKDYGFDENKDISSNPILKDILENIHGETFDKGEKLLKSYMRAATSFFLGPMTNAHIMGSSIANSLQYMRPSESIGAYIHAFTHIPESIQHAIQTGYHKPNLSTASDILDSSNTSFERVGAFANLIGNLSGRDFTNKYTKSILQGLFEYLTPIRIKQANEGDRNAVRFMRNADPEWEKGKEYSQDDIIKLASNNASIVHGAHDPRTLPGWMLKDTAVQPFASLMSWNIAQTNAWMKNVFTPAKEGNFVPLIMSTLGSIIGGYVIKNAREAIADKKSPIPSLTEIVNSSRGVEGNIPLVAYNLMAMSSYVGYAGILSVTAKAIEDIAHKNIPQGAAFPLDEVMSNSGHRILQAVGAAINDPNFNYFDGGVKLLTDLTKENFQLGRIAISWLANTGEFPQESYAKALNVKTQDLRRFQMTEGLPYEWQTPGSQNPYMDIGLKKFKRTEDIGEAMQQLPSLIQDAFQSSIDAGGNIDILKKKLNAVKQNSYETMPSPDKYPQTFMKYLRYLAMNEGPEEATNRLVDYIRKNTINKAKAEMVPTF